jgi:hypothetical protein
VIAFLKVRVRLSKREIWFWNAVGTVVGLAGVLSVKFAVIYTWRYLL